MECSHTLPHVVSDRARLTVAAYRAILESVRRKRIMKILYAEDFQSLLNCAFHIELGVERLEFALTLVQSLPVPPSPIMVRAPFRLVFQSDRHTILPQKVYQFASDVLGRLDIFIVPIGRDEGGVLYEAVFN